MATTITVNVDGETVTFDLDDDELSQSSNGRPYLSNASRDFIADEVEKALVKATAAAEALR